MIQWLLRLSFANNANGSSNMLHLQSIIFFFLNESKFLHERWGMSRHTKLGLRASMEALKVRLRTKWCCRLDKASSLGFIFIFQHTSARFHSGLRCLKFNNDAKMFSLNWVGNFCCRKLQKHLLMKDWNENAKERAICIDHHSSMCISYLKQICSLILPSFTETSAIIRTWRLPIILRIFTELQC